MGSSKKFVISVVLALFLILVALFIYGQYLNHKNAIMMDLNLNEISNSKFNLQTHQQLNPAQNKVSTGDLPICAQLPVPEVSSLNFNKKIKYNNTEVEFSAQYETQKLPPLNTLFISLKNMIVMACGAQTYPMVKKLILPSQIWNQLKPLKPKPYTYHSGSKNEHYSIGLNLIPERVAFKTKEECLNQGAFQAGDEIVFYGFKNLGPNFNVEADAKITCSGQYDSLDHWEVVDKN